MIAYDETWPPRLRAAREDLFGSIQALLNRTGVARKTYKNLEAPGKGRCRVETWRRVLTALGLYREWRLSQAVGAEPGMQSRMRQLGPEAAGPWDVFVASGMESLPASNLASETDWIGSLTSLLRARGLKVFAAGESRPRPTDWEDAGWALALNDYVLANSRRFVLLYPEAVAGYAKPLATSALIELGMAIQRRLPTLVLHRGNPSTLPYLIQKGPSSFTHFDMFRIRHVHDLQVAVEHLFQGFFTGD